MPRRYKVLITGSSGMLGMDLADELRCGYDVIGADLVQRPQQTEIGFYKADITNRNEMADVIKKAGPDIVVHAAAWTDVDGCELDRDRAYFINSDGTGNVALACNDTGAKMIYISTDFVFDGRKRSPYKENDQTSPLNVYAGSKLKGEVAVERILKEYFIIRTSWLYGRHGKNFVDTILTKARDEGMLKVADDQVGSPTYSVDLAKAIRVLVEKIVAIPSGSQTAGYGIYHVSNTGSVSWYEYAKTILKSKGVKAKVIPISSKQLARPAKRPAMSVMDNSKFKKFTGYRMRAWKSALREYLG